MQTNSYTCAICHKSLHAVHVYAIDLATCLSRTTQQAPAHLLCARARYTGAQVSALWLVKPCAWNTPSAKGLLLNDEPHLYLHAPHKIEFWTGSQLSTYDEIKTGLLPVLKTAIEHAAGNPNELGAITRQVAWLHKFLPKADSEKPNR